MAKTNETSPSSNDAELLDQLAEAKEELFNLRFQHATGQLDNSARIPQTQAGHRPHQDRAARPRDRGRRGGRRRVRRR